MDFRELLPLLVGINRGLFVGTKQTPQVVPPGVIWEYGGASLPDPAVWGVWLWADNSLVDRSQYPDLFKAIGFAHSPTPGQDPGNNKFYLPNRKGRSSVGVDVGQTEFNVLGAVGGSKSSTASHSHAMATHNHDLQNHVHGGAAHWHGLENHTHYTSTGYMSANWNHQHTTGGNPLAQVYTTATSHSHQGSGGTTSEQPWGGGAWATNHTHGDTDSRTVDHVHGGESGWFNSPQGAAGATFTGNTGGASGNTSGGAQSIGAAQDSSAVLPSGNLPPYVAMNFIIKV
jgi:Phage Tail Collar Domain